MENFEMDAQQNQEPVCPVEMPAVEQEQPVCPAEMPAVEQEQPVCPVEMPVAEQPVKKKKSGRGVVAVLVVAVVILGVVAGYGGGAAWVLSQRLEQQQMVLQQQIDVLEQRVQAQENKPGNTVTLMPGQTTDNGGYTPAQVYAAYKDSVVLIQSTTAGSGFSAGGTSTGSGFILTADGYVVTNYHVVEGGSRLTVVTTDSKEHAATLIGYDNANDVALLKIEAENLTAVVLGDSDSLIVGDQVAAIGNPLGELTSTLTVGYVSAKERDVNTSGFAINMIQTDAAINSGNSGGPLFNMAGQVIGITTAKYSGSSSSGASIEGIGFAIPINDVADLLDDLATHGYAKGPYLGVSVSDIDAQSASYFGMPMGVYVNEVVEGYCAHKAGMQAKDIITQLGDETVESVNELTRALRKFAPGDTVEITIYRAGAQMKLSVTLDEKPREEVETSGTNQLQPSDEWYSGMIPGFGG